MVDNKINKFRHVILEILHRLPNNEVLKPHVQEVLLLVMSVVDSDNEDNAIQGLRVVFDLQKNYRPQLESEVPRFLQVWRGENELTRCTVPGGNVLLIVVCCVLVGLSTVGSVCVPFRSVQLCSVVFGSVKVCCTAVPFRAEPVRLLYYRSELCWVLHPFVRHPVSRFRFERRYK